MVGLVEAVRARVVLRHLLAVSAPLRILLALIAVAGVRLLWDLPTYGMDATRDYSVFYYGILAFLVAAAALSDPTFTPRLLRWYRTVLPWFLLWVTVAVLLARHQPLAAITIPGSTTPINAFKASDLVVMTTMARVFLWLGVDRGERTRARRRRDDWLTGVGVVSLLVICSQSRVAMVVILAVFGTALLLLPSSRRRWVVLALGGGIVLVVAPVLVFGLQLQLDGRRVSLQQVGDNVPSGFSRDPLRNEAETGLQDTVRFGQELFGTVLEQSLVPERALAGRGFGPILSSEYLGREPQDPGAPRRSVAPTTPTSRCWPASVCSASGCGAAVGGVARPGGPRGRAGPPRCPEPGGPARRVGGGRGGGAAGRVLRRPDIGDAAGGPSGSGPSSASPSLRS